MASSSSLKVIVVCSEGRVFVADEALVNASETLKSLVKEKGSNGEKKITFQDIPIEIMSKINEYVKKHAEVNTSQTLHLDAWDEEFIKVDLDTLYNIIMAANYLKIEDLEYLGAKTVANIITGKSPEEIRQIFNIKNDFTPKEEKKIRREFPWAFKK